MDYKYLITLASFEGFEDLSINIEEARINVFIRKAQELDLCPFMGDAFYYDFITKVVFASDGTIDPATPQIYIDLLIGKQYTYNGKTFYFDGIIPTLIYFAFARFIEADSVRYTATGPVLKHHDQADPMKLSDIAKLVTQQRSTANAYANKVTAFLNANRALYPLWRYNERNASERQPGPRISGIDKTRQQRYGNRGNYGYYNGLL